MTETARKILAVVLFYYTAKILIKLMTLALLIVYYLWRDLQWNFNLTRTLTMIKRSWMRSLKS